MEQQKSCVQHHSLPGILDYIRVGEKKVEAQHLPITPTLLNVNAV